MKALAARFVSSRCMHLARIRNIGIFAHIDAGKTTTSEQMLFVAGQTKSVGRVDNGDTVLDFLPQEKERGITISSAAVTLRWKDFMVNLIDTPGHVDFTIEVERSARVLDGAVLVIDAVAGVQAQTQTVWKQVRKQSLPTIAFVNKMDRDGASFDRAVSSMNSKLGINAVKLQLPIGSDDLFSGACDLISMTAWSWDSLRTPTIRKLEHTDAIYSEAYESRQRLLECLAEHDEEFMDKYLSVDDPNVDLEIGDIILAVRRACIRGSIVPTLCGASLRGKGVEPILDSVVAFLPSPSDRPPCIAVNKSTGHTKEISCDFNDLSALAFKVVHDSSRGPLVFVRTYSGTLTAKQSLLNTTRKCKERVNQLLSVSADDFDAVSAVSTGNVCCIVGLKNTVTGDTLTNERSSLEHFVLDGLQIPPAVFSVSIEPERSSQQTELEKALSILRLEDPSLEVEIDKESGQTILRGIGELHLEIVRDKLLRQFQLEVVIGKTYVAYRETIADGQQGIEHTYDRMIGTKRMFASILADIESTEQSAPEVSVQESVKKSLTADEYVALVDGLLGSFGRGPYGFPVIGVKVVVTGVHKDGDTTPGSIRACASTMVDAFLRSDKHLLLEPVMAVEVALPSCFVGDVLSDLTVKRRGHIEEVTACAGGEDRSLLSAEVPLATMLGYATSIRSITQGEGSFVMEFNSLRAVDVSIFKQEAN